MSTRQFFKCHPGSNWCFRCGCTAVSASLRKLVLFFLIKKNLLKLKSGKRFKLFFSISGHQTHYEILSWNITCHCLVLVSLSVTQKPGKEDLRELKSQRFPGGMPPDLPGSLLLRCSFRKLVSIYWYPRSIPEFGNVAF